MEIANNSGIGEITMKSAYTAIELSALLGISPRAVHKRADEEGISYLVKRNARGGGEVKVYELKTLPEEWRERISQVDCEKPAPSADEVESYLATRRIRLSTEDLSDPAVQAKIACAKALEAAEWGRRGAVLSDLASRYGKTEITIRRWADEVEEWRVSKPGNRSIMELCSLAGTPGPRIEIPDTKKFSREAIAFGLQLYAKNLRNGQKAAYRAMCEEAKKKGWEIGDYSNFTRAVKRIPEGVWDQIRRGAIGFERDYVPKVIRAWLKVPVMTVLCGDQHIFDYQVFDPATGDVFTPECYVWMDCTSRMWPGVWPEFGHYNSFTAGHALREACRYGIPDEVFTDWGKPENSKHMSQLVKGLSGFASIGSPIEYRGKYESLDGEGGPQPLSSLGSPASAGVEAKGSSISDAGNAGGRMIRAGGKEIFLPAGSPSGDDVRHRRARPGVPWLKPIENQMNVLERELADRFLTGYRKRDADAWVNKQRMKELKESRLKGRLLSVEEFFEVFWVVVRDHNGKEMRVKEAPNVPIVPSEVFFRGLIEQSRPAFDNVTLDYLCMPRYERQVRQSTVELTVRRGDRRGYYSPLLSGVKERVQVSVDPYDRAAPAIVTDLEGRYIDLAQPWNVQDPKDKEGLTEKMIRQAELRRWWKQQMKEVLDGFGVRSGAEGGRPGVVKISGATQVARRASADRRVASELKPKVSQAGKRLEEMYDRLKAQESGQDTA